AMACGKPVVATHVDGIPEAVTDGVTGYLFAPGAVSRAVSRVLELLDHPGRARRMGEEGRRQADLFDIREMVRRQEGLYLDLLDRAHGGRV
ncbi:MAG: glycosyltransferase, partial [Acidobacteriota bacterium]